MLRVRCAMESPNEYMSFRVYDSMNVSAYACICGPVNKRSRSSETHFHYGYRHNKICVYGC